MKLEIPLFFHSTDIAVVDETHALLSVVNRNCRNYSSLDEALSSINIARFEYGCAGQVSVLLFGESVPLDRAISTCDNIKDKNIQTLYVSETPACDQSNVFNAVLSPNLKNFEHILQRKVRLLQREYFTSASKAMMRSEQSNMMFLYDDAVADHFDFVCFDKKVDTFYYDERISAFILTSDNGDVSIWAAFRADLYSVNDIAIYMSSILTRVHSKTDYAIEKIESENNYWCVSTHKLAGGNLTIPLPS